MGRDIAVVIATRYELNGPGIETRWGAKFSAPVQTDPEAHPASYTLSTGSFPGLKRPGLSVNQPPHLAPKLKKEKSYTSAPLWAYLAFNFTFTFHPVINREDFCRNGNAPPRIPSNRDASWKWVITDFCWGNILLLPNGQDVGWSAEPV